MDKIITIYDVFELNRVLHFLLEQQSSYKIQTAFKIHSLIKWLDETEGFIFERMSMIFGTTQIDFENDALQSFLLSQIPFVKTSLKCCELLDTIGDVKLNVNDVNILEKMLDKTED